MNTGKLVRMNRLFSHPSGRLCSKAVDHFIGYGTGLPAGLSSIQPTLVAIVSAWSDAVTMHKGIAASAWAPHAGSVSLVAVAKTGVGESRWTVQAMSMSWAVPALRAFPPPARCKPLAAAALTYS